MGDRFPIEYTMPYTQALTMAKSISDYIGQPGHKGVMSLEDGNGGQYFVPVGHVKLMRLIPIPVVEYERSGAV
jgi:hypothetical protein